MLRIFTWAGPLIGALLAVAVLQIVPYASSKPIRNPEDFDYNFTLRNAAGERITFDQYKGKVVFLNIWATWCGPCRKEMPTIQSLYEKMGPEGVEFVMLSVDRDENEPRIGKYISQYGYTFPVYRPSGTLTSQLDVPGIPTTFIINKEGKIVSKEVGATNFDTAKFRKFLSELVKQ